MTGTAVNLESSLQALIDDRLDAVDRVLLRAGVSRGERRNIVEEVEAQIHELLSRKTDGDLLRVDVLAVLNALDPPEAYAPEGHRQRVSDVAGTPRMRLRRPEPSLLALGSAAGGIITAFLAVLASFLVIQGEFGMLALALIALLVPAALAVTACGILAIVRIRRSDGWLFGLRAALLAAILFPLLLGNAVFISAGMLGGEVGLIFAAALAMLACNAGLVYHVWKLLASGYKRATPEFFVKRAANSACAGPAVPTRRVSEGGSRHTVIWEGRETFSQVSGGSRRYHELVMRRGFGPEAWFFP